MIVKKNIAMVVILSLITCGIYYFYWIYTTTRDINLMIRDNNNTDPAMAVIFSIITCGIYNIYWFYKYGNRMFAYLGSSVQTVIPPKNGTFYLILMIAAYAVGITVYIAIALFSDEFNQCVDVYYNTNNNFNDNGFNNY